MMFIEGLKGFHVYSYHKYMWELSKRSLTGAFIAKVLGYAVISLG